MKRFGKICALALMFLFVCMALPQSAVAPAPPLPFWKTNGNVATPETVFGTLNEEDLRIITNGQQRMVITSDGNIGIGTTNPSGRLEVVGDIVVSGLVDGVDVDVEVADLHASDIALQAAIDAEAAMRAAEDAALQAGLDAEEAARIAADVAEAVARAAADQALQDGLDAEVAARIAGDVLLTAGIDAEEAARVAADIALQNNIDAEEAARIVADVAQGAALDAHAADPDAHHSRYTDAEAVVALQTADLYLQNSGDTMYGNLDMNTHNILNVGDPVNVQDAATKKYVDSNDFWIGGPEGPGEIPSGALAFWHMDEGSGGTAFDATVNGYDGTLIGPTWTSEGKYGNALDFDGSNDYVEVTGILESDMDALTLSAWVNYDTFVTTENGHGMFAKFGYPNPGPVHDFSFIVQGVSGNYADSYFQFGGTDTSRVPFDFVVVSPKFKDFPSLFGFSIDTDTWYMVTATYDRATTTAKIFVNDVEVASQTVPDLPIHGGTQPLWLGRNQVGGSYERRWMDGTIDEAVIYQRALTTSEIEDLYASGKDIYYDDGNVGIGIINPSEKLEVNGNVKISGDLIVGGNIGIQTIHVSQITGLLGQGYTVMFPDILDNLAILEIENITLDDRVVILNGPGYDIENIEHYNQWGDREDMPGNAMEHPLIFEPISSSDTAIIQSWFDEPSPQPRTVSLVVNGHVGEEVLNWDFYEFIPDGYEPGVDGRTRFTLVCSELPDNVAHIQLESDNFGSEHSVNPETDYWDQVLIDGINFLVPAVEFNESNQTLTLSYDFCEAQGVFPLMQSFVEGRTRTVQIVLIKMVEGHGLTVYTFDGCFPTNYEYYTGFGLSSKGKVQITFWFVRLRKA